MKGLSSRINTVSEVLVNFGVIRLILKESIFHRTDPVQKCDGREGHLRKVTIGKFEIAL